MSTLHLLAISVASSTVFIGGWLALILFLNANHNSGNRRDTYLTTRSILGLTLEFERGPGGATVRTEEAPAWFNLDAGAGELQLVVDGIRLRLADALPAQVVSRITAHVAADGWAAGGRAGRDATWRRSPRAGEELAQLVLTLRSVTPSVAAIEAVLTSGTAGQRAAAARWLARNAPERREALLLPLLADSDEELRAVAAEVLEHEDALAALILTAHDADSLSRAVTTLFRLDPERAGTLVAARIRARKEPWAPLLTVSAPPIVQALEAVIGEPGPLPQAEATVRALARHGGDWQAATERRVREHELTASLLDVVAAVGDQRLYEAVRARSRAEEVPGLRHRLGVVARTIGARLGIEQDGELSLGGGGELGVAEEAGAVAVHEGPAVEREGPG